MLATANVSPRVMDIPTPTRLIELIDAFLLRHDMAPTRFGRDAVKDPNFLTDLREGRKLPGMLRLNAIAQYMAEKDAAAGHVVVDTDAAPRASSGTADAISGVGAAA